jgi:FMN reductase
MDANARQLVVGIGGSTRATSLTDELLRTALAEAEVRGARTMAFGGAFLAQLPIYVVDEDSAAAGELVTAVASADGLIIATPGYHGGMSGLVKNGMDHLESLRAGGPSARSSPRPDGRRAGPRLCRCVRRFMRYAAGPRPTASP